MNIGDRLSHYERRAFTESEAAVNVLLEVALQVLSAAFPETFVCFGGSALVLFFGSARISADLDLLVYGEQTPTADAVIDALASSLAGAAQLLSLSTPSFTTANSAENHYKIWVSTNSQRLFSIDVTKISGTIHSEVTEALLAIDSLPSATAKVVTRNWMLLQKAEAFLTRRFLKVRDAYDIKVLLDAGAALDENLRAHLSDGRASERLEDPAYIKKRIAGINARICELELRPVLPREIYDELAASDFAKLRHAVSTFFADWLEE